VVNKEKHPGAKGLERWQDVREALVGIGEFLDFTAVDGFDESVASREVAIERARADAGPACDVVEARRRANKGEDFLGYLKNAFTVALCIGAGFAGGLRRWEFFSTWERQT
jgi:hypothetical protein